MLASVTYNGRQLIMTGILVIVTVYLYTIISFNFYRFVSDRVTVLGRALALLRSLHRVCGDACRRLPTVLPRRDFYEHDITQRYEVRVAGVWGRAVLCRQHCCIFMANDLVACLVVHAVCWRRGWQPNGNSTDNEFVCDTLYQSFFYTLNEGLRNGGGIGDALVTPSFRHEEDVYFSRLLYDLTFFAFVVIILLNGGTSQGSHCHGVLVWRECILLFVSSPMCSSLLSSWACVFDGGEF